MNDNIQLTTIGLEKLKQELDELVTNKRPLAVERLQKARSMGDLKENSEYAAAKEDLAFVEGRIQEIEAILKKAVVAQGKTNNETVEIGNQVLVEKNGLKEIYTIVGEYEADPLAKKLSPTSPLGKALLSKKVNELAEVEAPAGKIQYKILEIK